MTAVLALLQYVVTVLLSLVGITQSRADQLTVNRIYAAITDPAVGLAALHAELISLSGQVSAVDADVLALGAPQQTAVPVTLPTVPPTGYGGTTDTAAAAAVWAYDLNPGTSTMFDAMARAFGVGDAWGHVWGRPPSLAHRSYSAAMYACLTFGPSLPPVPAAGLDTILPTDADVGAWLARVLPTWTFTYNATYDLWLSSQNFYGYTLIWICTLSAVEFVAAGGAGGPTGALVAPVWPGLANVTYGSPQSMDAPNGSLSGPADGYKIVIDATPSWAGTFDFGSVVAWRNVGAIAFVDDEGVPEPAQTLGLANVIYTPQRMKTSVGAYYRLNLGYHCVATPFTIN